MAAVPSSREDIGKINSEIKRLIERRESERRAASDLIPSLQNVVRIKTILLGPDDPGNLREQLED